MPSASTIRLFASEPDLLRFVPVEEHEEAAGVELPLRTLPKADVDVRELLARSGSFGALLLDGMLLQSIRLGERVGLRLLGPGDVLSVSGSPGSMLISEASCRATVPTRVVLLRRELLLAARRWPGIVAGLHARAGEQAERLVTQLMICQLPRVDDRLLAMFWLLAESWGRVTSAGTELPVALTHEALGGLIGARRPTVTLALGELTECGAIMRWEGGWMLLRQPVGTASAHPWSIEEPRPLAPGPSSWADPAGSAPELESTHAALRETVMRLGEEHRRNFQQQEERLLRAQALRARVAERRRRATAGMTAKP